jgi:hypothetical protein
LSLNDLFSDVADSARMVLEDDAVSDVELVAECLLLRQTLHDRTHRIFHTIMLEMFQVLLVRNRSAGYSGAEAT